MMKFRGRPTPKVIPRSPAITNNKTAIDLKTILINTPF
tara:strand:- start:230 stop:343 length:114 start_codon:yes stop_codon:yes gene_type:complete